MIGNKETFRYNNAKIYKPKRMCISCRIRFEQEKLIRLQCIDANIVKFSGSGRSFYLCENCVDAKNTPKALSRQCRLGSSSMFMSQIKEIIANVR